jgi:hypothetical protein
VANFKKREAKGIIFVGHHVSGQSIKREIKEGDNVVLRIDNESVLVRNVHLVSRSHFIGEVYGFEPSFALEYQGINIGYKVEFEEEHIISCSD